MKLYRLILSVSLFALVCAGAHAQYVPAMAPPAFDPNLPGYSYGYQPGYGYNPYPGLSGGGWAGGGWGGGWGGQPQQPPAPPPIPGFSRAQCINFEFQAVRPSAALKIAILRTSPANRRVLYQRALFVMKHDTDALAKATADWVRQQIEAIPPAAGE